MQDNGITPSQTVGPFFKYGLTPNGEYAWNDAFTNSTLTPDVTGDRVRIEGRVFDGDGVVVPDVMLEIWQADADGRFADPQDKRALPNASFRGFARFAASGPSSVTDSGSNMRTTNGTSRSGFAGGAVGHAIRPLRCCPTGRRPPGTTASTAGNKHGSCCAGGMAPGSDPFPMSQTRRGRPTHLP